MILILGDSGQLGTAFRSILGSDALYLDQPDIDLSQVNTVYERVSADQPELIINCAAYTAVDRAESEPEIARAINADAVREMARAAGDMGAGFVTFSTDYVFDGASTKPYVESDMTDPINAYGQSKRVGEIEALEVNPETLVVRTSWLLSGTHPNFASTMLRLAAAEGGRIVSDQRGHPTLVDDLAPAVLDAVDVGVTGLLHLTNQGSTTWFELAREIAKFGGFDPTVFEPCTTAEYPTPAQRPENSVLDSERLDDFGLNPMPDYRDGIERAVAGLQERGIV
jgi:dTDP-4-dehydrorhamnose reductase